MNKKLRKFLATSILASSMIFSVGCNSTSSNTNIENTENSQLSNNVVFEEDENTIYGKVTNISNNQITLSLGTMNINKERPDNNSSKDLNDNKKPDMSSNSERPEPPSDGERPKLPSDGERPEPPQGEDNQLNKGNRPEMITLTGEEKIITISDNITITKKSMKMGNSNDNKNNNEETLTISDISVGDILKVKYNEDKITIESVELISNKNKNIKDDKSTEDKKDA